MHQVCADLICIRWVHACFRSCNRHGSHDITALTYLKFPIPLQILTIAVLSILLTAPTGAVGIAVSGPRLLRRSETKQETGDKGEVEPILDGSNPQMDSTV